MFVVVYCYLEHLL